MPRDMVQVRRGRTHGYSGPDISTQRSQFNRSHGLKMTFDASYLYPVFLDEVLPGDTMTMSLNGFARVFSPLDSPIMDNIQVDTFFFFVPTRLIWDNWKYFQGEHDQAGAQDTNYTIPIMPNGVTFSHDGGAYACANLGAFLGLPDGLQSTNVSVSALPFRAYNLIYNEWFRDQNLIDEVTVDTDNGPDTAANYQIWKSAKKHDYFTAALPYLQKGTAQTVALSGTAPVTGIGVETQVFGTGSQAVYESDGTNPTYTWSKEVDPGGAGGANTTIYVEGTATSSGYPNIFADLSSVSVDINALRQSVAIQRLLERDARGGTRYTEIIKTHFGVTSPDFRLQRPEYLGGGRSFINISPIANSVGINSTDSPTSSNEYQGELKGIGTGVIQGHGWAKSFTEHGYILGIIRARGDITYFQGVEKLWTRSARYDFYLPALAHLGEQAILNKELYVTNGANDNLTFGYQERWAEYRQKQSRVVGLFNPDATGTISHWHLAEDFSALPSLNQTFIEDGTPMSRVQTYTTGDDFLLDLWFDYKCARPIPVRSIPSLVGRF